MQATAKIKAQTRTATGTRAARRLRGQGLIPAIIYGHKETPAAVVLPEHEVELALEHGSHLLEVDLDGSTSQCLIKDVQYDHLGHKPIHVDLARVSLDERVQVAVPIELRGTPAGVSEGGVLDQILMEVQVECLVTQIPESIRVRVGALGLNQTLRVRELELPAGVTALVDGEEPVCTIRPLGEEPAEAPVEGPAEPEVITREKAEEEPET
jgi:large subunit ribosomal protein L25